MIRTETRQEKLARLATRLCAGEVVFFIGAGFSLDSEGNSTSLLIARLLARFEAMAEQTAALADQEAAAAAKRLRAGLRVTFSLENEGGRDGELIDIFDAKEPADKRPSVLAATLRSLGQNYYLINDWICSAFESLIAHLAGGVHTDFVQRVNARENELLRRHSKSAVLDPIDLAWYVRLHAHVLANPGPPSERSVAGKALFLDTLGFNSDEVMAGLPMHPELDQVAGAAGRLRLRHTILAWLAAEGLCSTLVTTNYDLLLDSAYRLAGMQPLKPPATLWTVDEDPLARADRLRLPLNRRYRHFTRVAQASQFFTHGDAHESAVIHKIHGCVETYRLARRRGDAELLRKVLPTIVFTFREIQNWREDSWSRDHLTTLMRTRTIVFAGYSGADQVIHDTFRTVYEEVAGYRVQASEDAVPAPSRSLPGSEARAFFTDRDRVGSFHGLEILRAASAAAGDPSQDLTDHPNLLTFFTIDTKFPTIDDIFTWIYHLAARELQAQALQAEVGRIAYQLFGRRCPEEEARGIIASFALLRRRESVHARWFDRGSDPAKAAAVRRSFQRLTRWTCVFNTALLREYQLAETLLRYPTDAFPIQAAAQYPWYRPLVEHPQWAAWAAILELAIRRSSAWYVGRRTLWPYATADVEVVDDRCPTLVYRVAPDRGGGHEPPVRRALRIELGTLRRRFIRDDPRRLFAAHAAVVWTLQPETIPWWTAADDRRPRDTPDARTIWQWAAFDAESWVDAEPTAFLGGSVLGRQQQRA